jgi:hypothetical protein
MKFSRSDFLLMRWNILAICASVLVSALALYISGEYAEKMQMDRRNAQSKLNDARSRLSTAHEDQKNMAIYADEYGTLVDRNIIGDDRRLDWMEGLEKLRRQNLVIDFRYNIAPQKIYAPQPGMDSGNFDVHYSDAKMQFDLLHEGQLLDFFSSLRRQIKGHYQLEGCTLKRAVAYAGADDEDDNIAAAAANIKAECSGGWITLKNRSTP